MRRVCVRHVARRRTTAVSADEWRARVAGATTPPIRANIANIAKHFTRFKTFLESLKLLYYLGAQQTWVISCQISEILKLLFVAQLLTCPSLKLLFIFS